MKNMSAFAWLSLITSFILLASCSAPPDVVVWEHYRSRIVKDPVTGHILLKPSPSCMKEIKEPECGHGMSIVSGKEYFVGEKTLFKGKKWSQLKEESLMCPALECYAPLAAHLIKECKKSGCDSDIEKFKIKVDSFSGIREVLGGSFP